MADETRGGEMQEPTEPMSLEEIDRHVGADSWRDHWPTERIPRTGRRRRVNTDVVLALVFSTLVGLAAGAVVYLTWQGGRQAPDPPVPAVSVPPAPSPSWLTLPSLPMPSAPPESPRSARAVAAHTTPAPPSATTPAPVRVSPHRPSPSASDSAKGSDSPSAGPGSESAAPQTETSSGG